MLKAEESKRPARVWSVARVMFFAEERAAAMTISAMGRAWTMPRPLVMVTSVFQRSVLLKSETPAKEYSAQRRLGMRSRRWMGKGRPVMMA
jgi:hypothetical protein